MRISFVLILLVARAFAQDGTAMAAAKSACGPPQVNFVASIDGTQHPNPQPDPDKALLFVVEDLGQCSDCGSGHAFITDVSAAVVRVSVDGSWVGADRGNSYFFVSVAPGEHHLCANWQSRISQRGRSFAMANFVAEAGKTYYFRAWLFPGESNFSFDLASVNSDEGKYLVASSPYSVSHPKK